jgi:hypothetical protein
MDPFTMMMLGQAGGNFLSDMFTNPSMPYQNAANSYQQWAQQGANAMNPFMRAGQGAIPQYQAWAKSMSNPQQFVNNLMSGYQESPNAKFMQQQAMRSGENMGSASGLMGSTPLAMQMQQNAGNISQQDMQNWMNNALGVNQMYGGALGNEMNMGEQGANSMMNMYNNMANNMGDLSYNEGAAQNNQTGNMFSDLGTLFSDF